MKEIIQIDRSSDELESIIKVEAEKFQSDVAYSFAGIDLDWPRLVFYDALKPDVVLERLDEATIRKFTMRKSVREQHRNSFESRGKPNRRILTLHKHRPYICDKCGNSFKDRSGIYHHLSRQHQVKNYLFCDLCSQSFNLKSLLEHHMLLEHSKEKLACSICKFWSSTTTLLQEHMEQVHPNKKECQICHKFVSNMSQHLEKHSQRKKPCRVCGNMMTGGQALKRHMNVMHGKNHKCDECGKGFNFYELRVHKLQAHSNKKLFFCHCGKVFKSKNTVRTHRFHVHSVTPCEVCKEICIGNSAANQHWLKNHLKTHGTRKLYKQSMKTTEKGVFKCEPCDTTYSTLMRLRIHQKEFHLLAPKTWTCDLCGKLFKMKSYFEKHVQKLHLKKYICEVCDHEADDVKALKVHRKVHEKRKKCPICHKMVVSLQNHKKTHDIVKCECKFCGSILGNVGKLKVHIAFMHKDGKANKKKCQECDAEFFYLDALKLHFLTTHFKGTLFKCDKCDAVFKARGELCSHTKNMHKTFVCQICCKEFKWQSLLTHWKNNHLEEHGTFTAYKAASNHFTKEGPFTCDVCNKVILTRIKISMHLCAHFRFKRLHGFLKHSSKRQPRFPKAERFCDICGKVFLLRSKLWSHIRKHLETFTSRHRRFMEDIPERIPGKLRLVDCSCDLCGKKLFDRKELRNHIQSHAYKLKIQLRTLMKAK